MPPKHIRAGRFVIDVQARPLLMAIVNLTPDSFSQDGYLRHKSSPKVYAKRAMSLVEQGADILDVGAQSTRPGAYTVGAKEEIRRLLPTLKELMPQAKVPVSVDSFHLDVIHAALDLGVSIVNNVRGLSINKKILRLLIQYDAAIVLMHMRGTPRSMQRHARYRNVTRDVLSELKDSVDFCLDFGLKKDKIIIDPGIGFSKDAEQSLILLNHIHDFVRLGFPVLVGPSRKSFLGRTLGDMDKDRTMATAASVALAVDRGAHIIRVHDVASMKDVMTVAQAIRKARA